MDELVLTIGGILGRNIVLRPYLPLYSTNDEYSYQIRMHVEIEAGPFRAAYDDDLEFPAFVSFRKELGTLYETLKGEATYDSFDAPLSFKIVGDGRGKMSLMGEAQDTLFSKTKLTFYMEFDQSYLPPLLASLDVLIARLSEAGMLKIDSR